MNTIRPIGNASHPWRTRVVATLLLGLGLGIPATAQQPDGATAWREELAVLQALNREQAALLAGQQQAIADLSARLEAVTQRLEQLERPQAAGATEPPAPPEAATRVAQTAEPQAAKADARPVDQRDGVGDLNAGSVAAGSFAGSILLPGTEGVSLAVGGFVKAVAIADSAAEALGADMLPSTLGTTRPDTAGNFAIDSTITRLHVDGRAHTGAGDVRAYVEYDLNATNNGALGFKLRHAYGTWQTGAGTLTAGHTWSTAMDLRILPEGLTEPTLSGAIFQRQGLLRWSFPPAGGVTAHLAVEDPSGTDIFTNQTPTFRTTVPDFIGALQLDRQRFHVRAGALVRRLQLEDPASGFRATATGWGAVLSGRVRVFGDDSVAASFTYGDGSGRYLLGLSSRSGAELAPDGQLRLRQGGGGILWYQHRWTQALRSTVGGGYAVSEVFAEQPDDAFRSTTYAYGNLMWSAMRFATFGAEYSFGRRATKDGSNLDNHRVMVGIQVF